MSLYLKGVPSVLVPVEFMYQRPVTEPFKVLVSYIIPCLRMPAAHQISQTVLRIQIDLMQAVGGIDDGKEPVAPGKFIVPGAFEKFSVEDPYEC